MIFPIPKDGKIEENEVQPYMLDTNSKSIGSFFLLSGLKHYPMPPQQEGKLVDFNYIWLSSKAMKIVYADPEANRPMFEKTGITMNDLKSMHNLYYRDKERLLTTVMTLQGSRDLSSFEPQFAAISKSKTSHRGKHIYGKTSLGFWSGSACLIGDSIFLANSGDYLKKVIELHEGRGIRLADLDIIGKLISGITVRDVFTLINQGSATTEHNIEAMGTAMNDDGSAMVTFAMVYDNLNAASSAFPLIRTKLLRDKSITSVNVSQNGRYIAGDYTSQQLVLRRGASDGEEST